MKNSITRKLVGAFGMLFADIEVREWDDKAHKWKNQIKVPIAYGPKEKWLQRISVREQSFEGTGSGFDDDIAITLPRMAFELTGITYDSSRKLNRCNFYSTVIESDGNKKTKRWVGIPYDYSFDLSIMVKNVEHGTKIVEQILPFFTPELNVTLKMTGDEEIVIDVPVILTGISLDDVYEDDFIGRRAINWTLNFTMKALTYGPQKTNKVIKTAITGYGVAGVDQKDLFERAKVIPIVDGKTLDQIISTDDFGWLTTFEDIKNE